MSSEGAPTVWTPEIVSKLEQAFCNDMNIIEACLFADISRATFYRHAPDGSDIRHRFDELRSTLKLQAKVHVAQQIKAGDKQTIQWWLERRGKDEFSSRIEQTGADGGAQIHKHILEEVSVDDGKPTSDSKPV